MVTRWSPWTLGIMGNALWIIRVDCLEEKEVKKMILAVLLVVVEVTVDYWQISRGKGINHAIEFSIFIIVSVGVSMLVQNPWFIALALGLRLLIFDYALNILRGLSWDYLGEGAASDRIFKKINRWVLLSGRCIFFALSAWLYY